MRRLISFAVIPVLAMLGCSSQAPSGSQSDVGQLVGSAAPEIAAPDFSGRPFNIADQKGKVVFLDFWATWCPPCVMSVPEVRRLAADYEGRAEIVSVSMDKDIEALRTFVRENQMTNPQLIAGYSGVETRYKVRGIPTFVLIDKEGRIANVWSGFGPEMATSWRQEIDRLLKA